ncbi:MAG: pirin family protein [Pseudomonadota bacterium]
MSYLNHEEADCTKGDSQISLRIKPREKDLGAFSVRRVLPASAKRMVGPFVFFDQMGPAIFQAGQGIDVRPHPHIGIATITYLFEGEILHKDSLGVVQPITPGEINLMTAGSGITHAERPGSDFNEVSRLFGIQSWIALPDDLQEIDPAFDHYAKNDLPSWTRDGVSFRLIMGSLDSQSSPVKTYSKTLYADMLLVPGAKASMSISEAESAIYVAQGEVRINEELVEAGVMAVLEPSVRFTISAERDARLLLIGGDPVGERHLYWNFVSNSVERIDRAKADWEADRFPRVPGDEEFIPLPD